MEKEKTITITYQQLLSFSHNLLEIAGFDDEQHNYLVQCQGYDEDYEIEDETKEFFNNNLK
ncbi:hypothetical protein [Carboxylicivirga sp. M1479]|uniref:hypothetical protein n=1 Tax=Carboxylicivirga sp. M1479 TaxID=2594476 RepID=UPI0011787EB7|nr:hypothetical protein [Carboxylicivirga sp. M1479]TRX71527.1 hypothetical protein FNN09_06030 [Carboxylicivirga sp. M1479]